MCLKKLSDFLVWKQYFILKNKIQNLEIGEIGGIIIHQIHFENT